VDTAASTIELDRISRCESVASWARGLSAGKKNILRLGGGINNDVYRVDAQKQSFVLKSYPALETGARDRMRAEVEFLQYVNKAAPSFVPRLIDFDFNKRAVLIEFIQGKPFIEGQSLSENQICDAIRFFETINRDRLAAKKMVSMDAAEGFLKLTDHLDNVENRISKLTTQHLPLASRDKSTVLIKRVRAEYDKVKLLTLSSTAKGRIADEIVLDQRCISPSDFGFHNAIQTANGVKFIDFEFAGWDDPAKASIDFVLQPRVPVHAKPTSLLNYLSDQLLEPDVERTNLLGAILRLKWLCIILSVLEPNRFDKLMKLKTPAERNFCVEKQLRTASAYFEREVPFGLH
jgi:hypothetical protein